MRPKFSWRLRSHTLPLGERTLLMGVVNATPDSFSDAGRYLTHTRAVEHALTLLRQGADIIDIGGESTRPGAAVAPSSGADSFAEQAAERENAARRTAVSVDEELRRVLPVIEGIRRQAPDAVLSIDTYKAAVAHQGLRAGAEIINDVSAMRWDPEMAATVAEAGCGLVLMHMRGRPEEWRKLPPIAADEMLALVTRELQQFACAAQQAGVAPDAIVLDPGFGFGKNYEENYPLLARLDELHRLGFPLLAGTSRKSFVGKTAARGAAPLPADKRLPGTLATVAACILKGAHVVRVHDVAEAAQAAAVADAIVAAEER